MYLCHVDLVPGELSDLESRDVPCDQDVVIGAALDDDLRLVGGGTGFFSGLVVDSILQLSTVSCDLSKQRQKKGWWEARPRTNDSTIHNL